MIRALKLVSLWCILLFGHQSWAQDVYSANSLDADDSGYVKTTIHHRDPAGIKKDQVSITEEGTSVPLESFTELDSTFQDKGDFILILFENHKSRKAQTDFFAEVIESAAYDFVDEDDEFLFASFDWNRDNLDNNCLDFADAEPTNNPDSLVAYASRVKSKGGHYTRQSTLIYRSIIEGIDYLDAIDTDKPKAIIVLSGGYSDIYDHENDGTAAKAKSLQAGIPVYSVTLKISGVADKYNLTSLCTDSYGLASVPYSKDQAVEASDVLIEYINSVGERAAGKTYEVVHQSTYEADCKSHDFQLSVAGSAPENISYTTQCPSWFEENKSLLIIMISATLLLAIIVFIALRRSKKARAQKDAEHERKVAEIEAQNQAAQTEIEKQKEALKHKEERERIQQEKALQDQKSADKQKQIEELIVVMQNDGFPRLTGTFEGEYGELVIDHPELTLGRQDGNYYTINHNTVSGNHAKIVFLHGKYKIVDLNSSNGTLVNGVKISEQELKHGDVVSLGEVTLTYLK